MASKKLRRRGIILQPSFESQSERNEKIRDTLVILMSKAQLSFGSLTVCLEDEKTNLIKLTSLAQETLRLLIPEFKSVALEEKKQMLEHEMKLNRDSGCNCGEEDCEYAGTKGIVDKKTNGLYI